VARVALHDGDGAVSGVVALIGADMFDGGGQIVYSHSDQAAFGSTPRRLRGVLKCE